MNTNDLFILLICLTVLISGYYLNFYRKGKDVKVISVASDNSLVIFRVIIPFAIFTSLFFYYIKYGVMILPRPIIYFGYFVVVFGLCLRWWAVRSLGKNFRVKVAIIQDQKLCMDGLYKMIRHPSYTGLLLYYFGLGIVMQNYFSLFILLVLPLYVVINRIKSEEIFLIEFFGDEYKAYQDRTCKLIPMIY